MNAELAPIHAAAGAAWTEVAGIRAVLAYDENTPAAVRAARETVALMDRSHWGRIRATGNDRHKFLHNMTTADFNRLAPGAGLEAVLTTATGRIVDYVTAYAEPDAILLVTSPERRATVPDWLRRFIFFNDDVQLEDVTERLALLSLYGPRSTRLLETFMSGLAELPPDWWTTALVGDARTVVARGAGLRVEGYNLIVGADEAGSVWQTLVEHGRPLGLELMGEAAWEQLRLSEGRPRADRELTEEHNPLEAGLWHAVSFDKGCYIGQEVIARLDTYQKVKQRLMGVRLTAPADSGSPLRIGDEEVGALTSAGMTEAGPFGLAYVRTKAAVPGQVVEAGDVSGELVEAPYLTWGRS